jgi:hypothetical protein
MTLSLKIDVNVPVVRMRFRKIRMFLDLLDPHPDPYKYVTDPQHWCLGVPGICAKKMIRENFSEETCQHNFQYFFWIFHFIDKLTGGVFGFFNVVYSLLLYLQYPTQNGIAG